MARRIFFIVGILISFLSKQLCAEHPLRAPLMLGSIKQPEILACDLNQFNNRFLWSCVVADQDKNGVRNKNYLAIAQLTADGQIIGEYQIFALDSHDSKSIRILDQADYSFLPIKNSRLLKQQIPLLYVQDGNEIKVYERSESVGQWYLKFRVSARIDQTDAKQIVFGGLKHHPGSGNFVIWNYVYDQYDSIIKTQFRFYDNLGHLLSEIVDEGDTTRNRILWRNLAPLIDGKWLVLALDSFFVHDYITLPNDCDSLSERGLLPQDFTECTEQSLSDGTEEQVVLPYTWEFQDNSVACWKDGQPLRDDAYNSLGGRLVTILQGQSKTILAVYNQGDTINLNIFAINECQDIQNTHNLAVQKEQRLTLPNVQEAFLLPDGNLLLAQLSQETKKLFIWQYNLATDKQLTRISTIDYLVPISQEIILGTVTTEEPKIIFGQDETGLKISVAIFYPGLSPLAENMPIFYQLP